MFLGLKMKKFRFAGYTLPYKMSNIRRANAFSFHQIHFFFISLCIIITRFPERIFLIKLKMTLKRSKNNNHSLIKSQSFTHKIANFTFIKNVVIMIRSEKAKTPNENWMPETED